MQQVEMQQVQIPTSVGLARAQIHRTTQSLGTLVLGHGAGGRSWSADLLMLTGLAASGWQVVLVEQPWRVAGRSVAARPAVLDQAWIEVLTWLTTSGEVRRPLVAGGRSAGARVAWRTAEQVGADALVALAFPLHPPGRPDRSRADELSLAITLGLPALVVQGRSDPFGRPEELESVLDGSDRRLVQVVPVAGGHAFASPLTELGVAVSGWLATLVGSRGDQHR